MPQILIISHPSAKLIQEQLSTYFTSCGITSDESATAVAAVKSAEVLVVVIDPNWQENLDADSAYYRVVETALRRSDMLVVNALIDGAKVPPITELPEALRVLAYIPVQAIRTDDHFPRDNRLLAEQIAHYLNRSPEADQSAPTRRRSGLPINLLIVALALAFGLFAIIAPRLRGADASDEPTSQDDPQYQAELARRMRGVDEEILIGLAAAFDQPRANDMLEGARLAIADHPTVTIDGQEFGIDLLTQDSACTAVGGLQTARLFTSSPSLAGVIGHLCDVSCTTAASIYNEAGFVTISPSCTAPSLNENPSFNRTVPSEVYAATAAADHIYNEMGVRNVAVVSDEIILGQQLAAAFIEEFTALGGTITGAYTLETTTASIPQIVEQVMAENPELIYLGGRGFNLGRIRENVSEDVLLFLADANQVDDLIERAGDAANGIYSIRLLPPDNPTLETLTTRYDPPPQSSIFGYAYDATTMLIQSLGEATTLDEEGFPMIDHEKLQQIIREYNGIGVTGTLNCNNNGNCASAESEVFVIGE